MRWRVPSCSPSWSEACPPPPPASPPIEVEGLKITIDSDWGTRTTPGYYPVRFDITNSGEARVIDLVGTGMRYLRVMRAAPGDMVVHQTVPAPRRPRAADHSGFRVRR